ncbi:phosphatidylserine decarboxylase [bacterium]|nr:phosphatidylserine decarboxylase [bacterium]
MNKHGDLRLSAFREMRPLLTVQIVLWILFLCSWIFTAKFLFACFLFVLGMTISGTLFFFRDPERCIPAENSERIVSPADGCVIRIQKHYENQYCRETVHTVSVFLRLWDVHVNRIPVGGYVEYLTYQRGRFHAAFNDKTARENEQMIIGIKNTHGRFLIRQVAGMIARRIVCHLKEGERVVSGARFGLIKMGSLVEISIPETYRIVVRSGQRVRAGETVIGILSEQS